MRCEQIHQVDVEIACWPLRLVVSDADRGTLYKPSRRVSPSPLPFFFGFKFWLYGQCLEAELDKVQISPTFLFLVETGYNAGTEFPRLEKGGQVEYVGEDRKPSLNCSSKWVH